MTDHLMSRRLPTKLSVFVLSAALSGCSSPLTPVEGPPATAWFSDVVQSPSRFSALIDETGRAGWIAFHAHGPLSADRRGWAASPSGEKARSRSEMDEAVFQADAAALSHDAYSRLFKKWDARGSFPAGSTAASFAALDAQCAGSSENPWVARAAASGDAPEFLAHLSEPGALFPDSYDGFPDPYTTRRLVHTAALHGDVDALYALGSQPLVIEYSDGFERKFYDPCLHDTLSRYWIHAAATDVGLNVDPIQSLDWQNIARQWTLPEAGLSGSFLAAWVSADDLRAELDGTVEHPADMSRPSGTLGATSPFLDKAGVARLLGPDDTMQAARDDAAKLTQYLDEWQKRLDASAAPEGKDLIQTLGLFQRFRQEWLLARARLALHQHLPNQALAYAELAIDPASPKVGPQNSPSAFAVLARAQLANGRTREALDALQRLLADRPVTGGVREIVADLAALESLDRLGDSKEN